MFWCFEIKVEFINVFRANTTKHFPLTLFRIWFQFWLKLNWWFDETCMWFFSFPRRSLTFPTPCPFLQACSTLWSMLALQFCFCASSPSSSHTYYTTGTEVLLCMCRKTSSSSLSSSYLFIYLFIHKKICTMFTLYSSFYMLNCSSTVFFNPLSS